MANGDEVRLIQNPGVSNRMTLRPPRLRYRTKTPKIRAGKLKLDRDVRTSRYLQTTSTSSVTNAQPTQTDRGLAGFKAIPQERTRGSRQHVFTKGRPPPRSRQTSRRKPLTRKQTADETIAEQDRFEVRERPDQIQSALENARAIRHAVPFLKSDPELGNIPLAFLLGWIDKESSGSISHEERNRWPIGSGAYRKDEVSLFQISIEEREKYLRLHSKDRETMLHSYPFSVHQGIRLVKFYGRWLQREFQVAQDSPAIWELVKLIHKSGIGAVKNLLQSMRAAKLDPSTTSWRDIKVFIAGHPQKHLPLDATTRVDFVMLRGRALEQVILPP
jgi:hypothetical protein